MAKQTTEPKSKSSTAKKDAELRKLLDKPDFHSFDRMMRKLVAIPKEEIDKSLTQRAESGRATDKRPRD